MDEWTNGQMRDGPETFPVSGSRCSAQAARINPSLNSPSVSRAHHQHGHGGALGGRAVSLHMIRALQRS